MTKTRHQLHGIMAALLFWTFGNSNLEFVSARPGAIGTLPNNAALRIILVRRCKLKLSNQDWARDFEFSASNLDYIRANSCKFVA